MYIGERDKKRKREKRERRKGKRGGEMEHYSGTHIIFTFENYTFVYYSGNFE